MRMLQIQYHAFGGVIAFNKTVDEDLLSTILDNQFVEVNNCTQILQKNHLNLPKQRKILES